MLFEQFKEVLLLQNLLHPCSRAYCFQKKSLGNPFIQVRISYAFLKSEIPLGLNVNEVGKRASVLSVSHILLLLDISF